MKISIRRSHLVLGRVTVSFQRTLRIPDDGETYPLPPGLGVFPIFKVKDYASRVPAAWRERGGVFIPMYQREAMWLSFDAPDWRPAALKVGVGGINAVSGRRMDVRLRKRPQDYVVVPDQPWLDGIKAGEGFIRQFVAMPLGTGATVEGQLTGVEKEGGLELIAFDPKPGRFPESAPHEDSRVMMMCCESPSAEMGIGAGGRMRQKVYPDVHGIDTWDQTAFARLPIHIVNSQMFREITGIAPPPTPISAELYTNLGLPWFELWDHEKADVPASKRLARVKGIDEWLELTPNLTWQS